MFESFGPTARSEVAYLEERARRSYHHHDAGEHPETLLHWVRRHAHVGHRTR